MNNITITECTRKNTCYDCDKESCLHQGDKGADCPKYKCDNPNGAQNCDECDFINDFIEEMREKFRSNMFTEMVRQTLADGFYFGTVQVTQHYADVYEVTE